MVALEKLRVAKNATNMAETEPAEGINMGINKIIPGRTNPASLPR